MFYLFRPPKITPYLKLYLKKFVKLIFLQALEGKFNTVFYLFGTTIDYKICEPCLQLSVASPPIPIVNCVHCTAYLSHCTYTQPLPCYEHATMVTQILNQS